MSLVLHLTHVARDNLLEVYAVDDHVNVLLVYHNSSVLLAAANIVIVRQNVKYTVYPFKSLLPPLSEYPHTR